MSTAVADELEKPTDAHIQARDELLALYSARRLSPVAAAKVVGVPVGFARTVKREWKEAIDDDLPANYPRRRKELACVLLVHLLDFSARAAGLLLGMPESDVSTVVERALEDDLQLLLTRLPVGVAFVAWAGELHRPAA